MVLKVWKVKQNKSKQKNKIIYAEMKFIEALNSTKAVSHAVYDSLWSMIDI